MSQEIMLWLDLTRASGDQPQAGQDRDGPGMLGLSPRSQSGLCCPPLSLGKQRSLGCSKKDLG